MPLRYRSTIALIAVFLLMVSCSGLPGGSDSDSDSNPGSNKSDDRAAGAPQPGAGSDLPVGIEVDGKIIIPNGRFISPQGNQVTGPRFIVNMQVSNDGESVFMVSLADRSISVLDADTLTITQQTNLGATFSGMALSADGTRLWVSGGGENDIYEFAVSEGTLTQMQHIRLFGYPTGLTLSPDESRLYVALGAGNKVVALDTSTGLVTRTWITENFPYEIAVSPDGTRGYVSNWGSASVTVFNTQNSQVIENVRVGRSPESVIYHDGLVYVACSDSDTIHVIDPSDNTIEDIIDVDTETDVYGHIPTHMKAFGDELLVVCSGTNSIAVIDFETHAVKAHIPTGWYPSSIAVDPANNIAYVGNSKGQGRGPGGNASGQPGTISVFDWPDEADYGALTLEVHDNNLRTANFYDDLDFESPIPTQRGTPSAQIKRVIFVLKENKTYDQVFGDLSHTESDPSLCVFCGDYTPNAHAIASRFANTDNFYSDTEASLMGHMWAMSMVCTDVIEKGHKSEGVAGEVWQVQHGIQSTDAGTIFQRLMEENISFRIYGEIDNVVNDMEALYPYVNLRYGFWNLGLSDEIKIKELINDFDKGLWPSLVYISLHNDHSSGGDPGAPTPGYYVADNDAALGTLIDYVSHSPYWNETAIFVTQDDPQSGADHVDAHRTLGLVASPWVKRGYTSSTLYTMSSMWLTMQLILGMDSLTIYDKNVAPMYDLFTMDPDYTPFDKIDRRIPLEFNPPDNPIADWSRRQIWDVPDQIPNLGEKIWKLMRPGDPFPYQLSVDRDEDEDDENMDAARYRERVLAWTEFAKAKGIVPLSNDLVRDAGTETAAGADQ